MIRYTTALLVLSCFGLFALESNAQARRGNAVSARAAVKTKASNEERRKQVEAMLLRGEYHHDGSGELSSIGTMDSVPALLIVLQSHPGNDMNNPYMGGDTPPWRGYHPGETAAADQFGPVKRERRMIYICTYIHAVHALRNITGQDLSEYEDWVSWWESYQKSGKAHK